MKHSPQYVEELETLITDRLIPIYYAYYREKKIPVPKPDIAKELTRVMTTTKCKVPRLLQPK